MLLHYKGYLIVVNGLKQTCKVYLQGAELSAPSIPKAKYYIDRHIAGNLIVKISVSGN